MAKLLTPECTPDRGLRKSTTGGLSPQTVRQSATSNPQSEKYGELARWGDRGSATGGAPNPGRRILHVEEETAGAAARRELTLALLGDLARFLAILAAHRERQRAKALLGD